MSEDLATESDPMTALAEDPALRPVIEEHGPVTLDPAEDLYERTVVALLRQQVSMESAAAIRERLFDRFEVTPEAMQAADPAELRDVGLSEAKTEYVKRVGEAFEERGYDREYFEDMTDGAVMSELTELRGIGPWTAKMFLMFCLGREDVFPVEDLGIRQGMRTLFGEEMTRPEMVQRAEEWRPYRTYASLLVWRANEA